MKKIILLVKNNLPGSVTIPGWLLLSSAFSIFLLFCRIIMTAELTYAFLAWNLFLAWIPYFISGRLIDLPVLKNKLRFALLVFLWLMFMPNTFYIITDLFHFNLFGNHHQWFDLTLILSFAWNGILFGIISLRRMETILTTAKGKVFSSVVVCIVMWLIAFGIYIGRYLRFNSWDVLANPFSLFDEIFSIFFNPYDHRWVWAMTICFSLFMTIIYYSVKKLSEAFR